ncbi:synaptonemal complex protein 2 [Sphaeramia orbicularis]|uniref:synaptonemal complex protein 2 n=1 Tax=Sphaeramia orbicularis TaxID=375764 RepID=UPI00117C6CAA|nr:synaptonemal complex protein 2 [Sphaeramia orbicularis]
MPASQDKQLETVLDQAIASWDVQELDVFLQREISESTDVKCSQQFLTKLNKFISRSLDQNDARSASLGLSILEKFGKNLKLPGGEGLPGLIAQGLIKKMVQWFEKCRQLWIKSGTQRNETLLNLSEGFFDALMVIHEGCSEGTYEVTESFLYRAGHLAVDPRIYILIQKEAIRKFNIILDKIPAKLKKDRKILTSQEASDVMVRIANHILDGGDYDLQTALMEALCRMANSEQRKQLADRWFSMEHVTRAFIKIRDSDFETDCRKFLNLVNGIRGDKRRVYSYPSLEVFLGKYELLMPADEKLEEFWIDFNFGSNSISFYFSLADEEAPESQWETICINENEVQSYTVTEENKRKVLTLNLSEDVVVGTVAGSTLVIHFSSSLDILSVVHSVYGVTKNKGFVGKTGISVVKNAVKVIVEDNSCQVVPESQLSLGESEKNAAPHCLPAPPAHAQIKTPVSSRMSVSSNYISSSRGGSVHGSSSVCVFLPPSKDKGKPSLEMVGSTKKHEEYCFGELRTTSKTSSHCTTPSSTVTKSMTVQSAASKNVTKTEAVKHQKNKPLAKVVDMVVTGRGDEQESLEETFVPDTQPKTGRNISSHWKKCSVSEMLMMPTQKISTLPVSPLSESCSSLAQQQACPPSARQPSVPASGPINQKQFHAEVTQSLQGLLTEKNQAPGPQEFVRQKTKISDTSLDFKGRSSADQSGSELCAPKQHKSQRNHLNRQKKKGKTLGEADAVQMKTSVKATLTGGLQMVTPTRPIEANKALSSKEKRDAQVAGSMVRVISSHYEVNAQCTTQVNADKIPQSWICPVINRPIFNMNWLPAYRGKVSGGKDLLKSHSKTTTKSSRQSKDIFAFSTEESQHIGEKDKTFNTTSATCKSSAIDDSSSLISTTKKKQQPVAKEKQYVKKHLFSDTDTDQAVTEISWLRESSRKPKPRVTKYPRQAPAKPKAVSPHTSWDSSNLPPPSPKPVNRNNKTSKAPVKYGGKQSAKSVKPAATTNKKPAAAAAGRRPQRAAANTIKNYKEPETDGSNSESEQHPPKQEGTEKIHGAAQERKKIASKQPRKNNSTPESNHHHFMQELGSKQANVSKLKPENVLQETTQKIQKPTKKNVTPAQEQTNALKDSWAACQASSSSSPPFIEKMRSAERSAPTLDLTCSPLLTPRGSPLPASPNSVCLDTPSPVLLLPKPCSAVGSTGGFRPASLYSSEKKQSMSKTRSIQSVPSLPSLMGKGYHREPCAPSRPSTAEMSPVLNHPSSSASHSPLSLPTRPLLTSTLLDQVKPQSPPQSPIPEDDISCGSDYGFSEVSPVSQVSLNHSSIKSSVVMSQVKNNSTAVVKSEKTPHSDQDPKSAETHVSGPSRKRHISYSSSSNSEENEQKQRKKSKMRERRHPRMKPRTLFKSLAEDSTDGAVMRQVISSTYTVRDPEAGDVEVDMDEDLELPQTTAKPSDMCRQFSTQLKRKFQNRYKMVEVYNKQSLKSIQQHVAAIDTEVTKYRTQQLEQVQKVLLEEIHKLEQADSVLKNMETDLNICWKKQAMAFHSYQQQEKRRNETLRKTLQNNVCHSVEYEEKIFVSQMCLIRKDMKSVQDRLLAEMQEGEIQSVKRGLHALFFPDGAGF